LVMLEVKVILIAIFLMALVFLGLATRILLKKGGTFPNTHIGGNKELKKRGISCAQTYDKIEQAKVKKEFRFKKIAEDSDTASFC